MEIIIWILYIITIIASLLVLFGKLIQFGIEDINANKEKRVNLVGIGLLLILMIFCAIPIFNLVFIYIMIEDDLKSNKNIRT